jgi:hypothetical protein
MLDYCESAEAIPLDPEDKVGIIEGGLPLPQRHWLELKGHDNQNSRVGHQF